jgi:Double zinc ribbon
MTACPSCGTPAAVDDRFCARCGTALAEEPAPARGGDAGFCTSCGAQLDSGDQFCGRCGRAVAAGSTDLDDEDDLLADWDVEIPEAVPLPPPQRDEAVTEQVPLTPRSSDTAVIPSTPVEPSAPPPVQYAPPPPAREPREAPRGFPLGATVALLGAVAVIVSAVLEWGGPFGRPFPRDIAFRLLFDPNGPATGPNLGVVLLAVGTVGALVALLTMAVPAFTPLRRLIGLLTLAIPAGFVLRTATLGDGTFVDLPSLLEAGVYVAVAGAFVEMVAGRWFRR